MKLKITNLALMTLFSASAFAAGVSTDADALLTPTLGNASAYSLTEIGDISSYDGEYITKYLDNGDGTYSEKYYEISYDTSKSTPTLSSDGSYGDSYTGNSIGNSYNVISITPDVYYDPSGEIFMSPTFIYAITGDFVANSATSIFCADSVISFITGDFIGNSYGGDTGAIFNSTWAEIGSITGDFIGNSSGGDGGAIYNYSYSDIWEIDGDFIANSASNNGGAIYNYDSSYIYAITGDFMGNSASNNGGAIYNEWSTVNFLALDDNITLTGNYVGSDGSYTSNAIYNTGTVNFNAYNGNSIVVNDGIDGSSYSSYQYLNINSTALADYSAATSYGTVEFNNTVENQKVNVYAGTLKLGSYEGGYINEEYTAEASVAALSNVALTVKDSATLNIAAENVSLTSSSITLESGATLLFDAYSSLVLDSNSSISVNDSAQIIIDLANLDSEIASLDIISFASAEALTDFLTEIYLDISILEDYSIADSALSVVSGANDLVYGTDYTFYLANGGTTLSISLGAAAAVPEPSTYAMIFGVIALGFAYYRRRK